MKWFISHDTIRSPFPKTFEKDCGEKVSHCYQCGKCSAGCPMSFQMDYLPNQIIRMIQPGMEEQVLSHLTVDCDEENWTYMVGVVPKILEQLKPTCQDSIAIVCGSPTMIKYTMPFF